MDISAEIRAINYKPLLCRELPQIALADLSSGNLRSGAFLLSIDSTNTIAVSWWVSAKRTRSYPYARVYDTLGFSGKKVTIIPVCKDEGSDGDRDFLQWDTVALMSLLGVNVIISYYASAEKNRKYADKITKQRFNMQHICGQIGRLLSFQSDALHWNLDQIDNVGILGQKALDAYTRISQELDVTMHSTASAEERINEILCDRQKFMASSRDLAQRAQVRESQTRHPLESLSGEKAVLTIRNYLGGYYFFTADEAEIVNDDIVLVEGKHSTRKILPALSDIKDGLVKMILFVNLNEVLADNKKYRPVAKLKLISACGFDKAKLTKSQRGIVDTLLREAFLNHFVLEFV